MVLGQLAGSLSALWSPKGGEHAGRYRTEPGAGSNSSASHNDSRSSSNTSSSRISSSNNNSSTSSSYDTARPGARARTGPAGRAAALSIVPEAVPAESGDGAGGTSRAAAATLPGRASDRAGMAGGGGDGGEKHPPFIHAMLAGGIGGMTGDMLMHSLDTVKTRQQGDPTVPPKYSAVGPSYRTIFREEGLRGLYGGLTPAFVGSFVGTFLFFGSYEWSKRAMIEAGLAPSVAYLCGGLVADLVASPIYVPTEVLKTRLQLQGRYNNAHFRSGYNYRTARDAAATVYRTEGVAAFFHGYRATIFRDLPFSSLQFAIYEQERAVAKAWAGSPDIGLPLEIVTGASAGGIAGVLTCPLDVVKTRVQTQTATPTATQTAGGGGAGGIVGGAGKAARLDTSSVLTGLRLLYRTEGLVGCFRGVGPRAIWTSLQSGTMLVLYQHLLRQFDAFSVPAEGEWA